MKKAKKLLALILTLTVALTMGVAMTSAVFGASLTIENSDTNGEAQENKTSYTYYQLMKADLSALSASDYNQDGTPKEGAKVVYYVENADLASALADTGMFKVTKVGSTSRYNVELNGTPTGEQIAEALNVTAVTSKAIATGTFAQNTGTSATVNNLNDGYYLVVASNGSKLVVQTIGTVKIMEKNQYPGIDKEITEENGVALTQAVKADDVNIGDTVTYKVPVTIPTTANGAITITDKMYKGLSLNKSSLANDKELTLNFADGTAEENYNVYTITISAEQVAALIAGQTDAVTLNLTYTATLNKDAAINADNKNIVSLQYDHYTTKTHETTTKTHKVEIDKVDQDGNKLAGVKFTLTREGTNPGYVGKGTTEADKNKPVWGTTATEYVTAETGNIVFDGLDAGTYTLTETYTPGGFNPLTAPITITVKEDGTVTYTSTDSYNTATDATAAGGVIKIKNQKGTTLPSTGGMGTTIFYILGALLVIVCGVVLVARRRMAAK